MTELVASGITLDTRLADVDFRLAPGELVAIVGPNGSGKTSLLRVLAGLREPDKGAVTLGGDPLAGMAPRERARRIAYLPQRAEVAWPVSVADMVRLARFAFGSAPPGSDAALVAAVLDEVGAKHLMPRSTATLSGGELALVALARVFAAETPLLLLDEPAGALDPRRQLDMMARLEARARAGQGIAVVLHDLNLAAQFAGRILWMQRGRTVAETSGGETLAARAADVFDVAVQVDLGPAGKVDGLSVRRGQAPE